MRICFINLIYMLFCMIQPVFTFDNLLQRLQLGKDATPFVIWHEKDLFGTHDNPVKIDLPCLFLCLDGEMLLDINLQPYCFNREHLLCFTTPCACRIVSRSPGFRCVGLLLSKAFWRQLVHIERTLGKIAIRNAFIALNEDFIRSFWECSAKYAMSADAWKIPSSPHHTARRYFMTFLICCTPITANRGAYHFMQMNFY